MVTLLPPPSEDAEKAMFPSVCALLRFFLFLFEMQTHLMAAGKEQFGYV